MVTQAAILKEYGLKYITVVKVGDYSAGLTSA